MKKLLIITILVVVCLGLLAAPALAAGRSQWQVLQGGTVANLVGSASSPTPTPSPTTTPVPADTVGPVCAARNASVIRGRTCKLYFKIHDALSAKVKARLAITTLSGREKVASSSRYLPNYTGWWSTKYRCLLRRGTYRIVVTGKDLAGNPASVVGRAKLVVK